MYTLRKEILVQLDTVAVWEKFVSMTSRSRIRGVDKTCVYVVVYSCRLNVLRPFGRLLKIICTLLLSSDRL